MKKSIITLIILMCSLSLHAAASSSESIKKHIYILNKLEKENRITADLEFVDYLEELCDLIPEDQIDRFIDILLARSDKQLDISILQEAIALIKFDPTIDPSRVHEKFDNTLPGENQLLKCTKRLIITGSISACTLYTIIKGAHYYQQNKPENVSGSDILSIITSAAQCFFTKKS